MDDRTLCYYDAEADRLASQYEAVEGGVVRYFEVAFQPGSRVLDIGAGTGRDMALLARSHEAWGLEPSASMRKVALCRHPELAGRIQPGALPDEIPDPEALGGRFDGILCSAVLQHLPRAALFDAVIA
ncbi:MAG: class I SAM-dependent methyltransferase, partial [Myxococcota bacterium]